MKEDTLIETAKELVEITIQKHKHKSLGKENMSIFIKNNLPIKMNINDYNNMLHHYNRFLADKGYEIRKDITKFDIINYNTEEYLIYISSIQHNKK